MRWSFLIFFVNGITASFVCIGSHSHPSCIGLTNHASLDCEISCQQYDSVWVTLDCNSSSAQVYSDETCTTSTETVLFGNCSINVPYLDIAHGNCSSALTGIYCAESYASETCFGRQEYNEILCQAGCVIMSGFSVGVRCIQQQITIYDVNSDCSVIQTPGNTENGTCYGTGSGSIRTWLGSCPVAFDTCMKYYSNALCTNEIGRISISTFDSCACRNRENYAFGTNCASNLIQLYSQSSTCEGQPTGNYSLNSCNYIENVGYVTFLPTTCPPFFMGDQVYCLARHNSNDTTCNGALDIYETVGCSFYRPTSSLIVYGNCNESIGSGFQQSTTTTPSTTLSTIEHDLNQCFPDNNGEDVIILDHPCPQCESVSLTIVESPVSIFPPNCSDIAINHIEGDIWSSSSNAIPSVFGEYCFKINCTEFTVERYLTSDCTGTPSITTFSSGCVSIVLSDEDPFEGLQASRWISVSPETTCNISCSTITLHNVTISKSGTGSGVVMTSNQYGQNSGIDCGLVCDGLFLDGSLVYYSIIPDIGSFVSSSTLSTFLNLFTVDQNRDEFVVFDLLPPPPSPSPSPSPTVSSETLPVSSSALGSNSEISIPESSSLPESSEPIVNATQVSDFASSSEVIVSSASSAEIISSAENATSIPGSSSMLESSFENFTASSESSSMMESSLDSSVSIPETSFVVSSTESSSMPESSSAPESSFDNVTSMPDSSAFDNFTSTPESSAIVEPSFENFTSFPESSTGLIPTSFPESSSFESNQTSELSPSQSESFFNESSVPETSTEFNVSSSVLSSAVSSQPNVSSAIIPSPTPTPTPAPTGCIREYATPNCTENTTFQYALTYPGCTNIVLTYPSLKSVNMGSGATIYGSNGCVGVINAAVPFNVCFKYTSPLTGSFVVNNNDCQFPVIFANVTPPAPAPPPGPPPPNLNCIYLYMSPGCGTANLWAGLPCDGYCTQISTSLWAATSCGNNVTGLYDNSGCNGAAVGIATSPNCGTIIGSGYKSFKTFFGETCPPLPPAPAPAPIPAPAPPSGPACVRNFTGSGCTGTVTQETITCQTCYKNKFFVDCNANLIRVDGTESGCLVQTGSFAFGICSGFRLNFSLGTCAPLPPPPPPPSPPNETCASFYLSTTCNALPVSDPYPGYCWNTSSDLPDGFFTAGPSAYRSFKFDCTQNTIYFYTATDCTGSLASSTVGNPGCFSWNTGSVKLIMGSNENVCGACLRTIT
jgi:hypothetical protein